MSKEGRGKHKRRHQHTDTISFRPLKGTDATPEEVAAAIARMLNGTQQEEPETLPSDHPTQTIKTLPKTQDKEIYP